MDNTFKLYWSHPAVNDGQGKEVLMSFHPNMTEAEKRNKAALVVHGIIAMLEALGLEVMDLDWTVG